MARPRPVDYLQPDEQATVQVRRHPLSALDVFMAILVGWGVLLAACIIMVDTVTLAPYAANIWTAFAMVSVAAVWGALLMHWRRSTSLYSVTGERVYMAYGRLRFHLLQTTYDKVTDLHVHQSIFGRIWGYGTVRVQTAGTGLALAGVVAPLQFKQRIEEERSEFLHTLVHSAKRSKGSKAPAPVAVASQWTGSPSGASLVGGLLGASVAIIIALVLLGVAMFVTPEATVGAAVTGAVGLFTAINQWIVYRYTGYEVTNKGVVVTRGWLSRRRIEATFAKVTDVAVHQGIVARVLGYGRITINTAGSNEAPVVFAGIANPDAVKQIIDDARGLP